MPNLICNLVWMPKYRGEAEVHPGGFDYVSINGYGHELLNFDQINGKLFGFVQTRSGTINIDRLGAKPEDDCIDGVRIIFMSRHQALGPVLIGWYENARVWRKQQPGVRSIPTHPNIKIDYQFEAEADRAHLVPVAERTFKIPNRRKGFPGHSPVFFPDDYQEISAWMQKFETYFTEIKSGSTDKTKSNKGSTTSRKVDAVRNALVEESAIEATIEMLGPEFRSRQPDNCGWDLEFDRNGKKLCVEVKGTSGLLPRAEVSPNEYRAIQRVADGTFGDSEYRLAIVTDALGCRKLHLFSMCADGTWACELTGASITATEKVAAVFG